MLHETDLLSFLNSFTDPLSDQGLARSNRISGIIVKGGHISFALSIPPHEHKRFSMLAQQLEKEIKALEGAKSCHIILTNERPAPSRLPELEKIKNLIVVGSGKGGVGKSTVALNIALGLVKKGLRIGLLDADIYGPSLPAMLNIKEAPTNEKKQLIPHKIHELQFMSIGLLVPDHTSLVWRGPMIQKALVQMLWGCTWEPLDALIIDMPPGTGDIQITLCQKARLTGAIIVSTPQDLSLLDAGKAIDMFRKVQVPLLGIIENMSQFACPQCHHITPIFDHGGARREADLQGIPFLGEIPLTLEIRKNKRVPELFQEITDKLMPDLTLS